MPDEPPAPSIVEHATCLACGCLCDDIRVRVEDLRIVEAGNACDRGRSWFTSPRPGEGHPAVTIDGRLIGLDEGLDRAARILRAARAPVVWGLAGTTIEAVGAALAIADRIGAVVDLAGSADHDDELAAFQRAGRVSASLGEVKDRADLVVFWKADPMASHPRHFERYSVEPTGRFLPRGRADRFVVVVDSAPSESSRASDLFVEIAEGREAETLDVLRFLVRGIAIEPDRASRSSGVDFGSLVALADRLKSARYGAWFGGLSRDRVASESLGRLIQDLNEGRRFVALGLGGPGNFAGASSVLGWQSGGSSTVDYGLGHPRFLPVEATLPARLGVHEVDAVLIVANDPADHLSVEDVDRLDGLPTIRVAPGASSPQHRSTVAFDVARPGLESAGTVARVDGVMLPLHPSISTPLPTDREILAALLGRLDP